MAMDKMVEGRLRKYFEEWDGQAVGWHARRARARPCARLGVSPGGKDPSTLALPRLKRWL
jgi:hypothetical protein